MCSLSVIICDRDAVIACSGVPKKEYNDKALSKELEQIIEKRSLYCHRDGADPINVLAEGGSFFVNCAMPIICAGDIVGCVASVTDPNASKSDRPDPEVESKLILTAAGFLGRQLES